MGQLKDSRYALALSKLEIGRNEQSFSIDSSFFEEFEYSLINEGKVEISAEIEKTRTHLDTVFHFKGVISLNCDRCGEPYDHPIDFEERVIFTFDPSVEFDTDEVILINRDQPELDLSQDFYDFISLQVPLRRVPEPEVHVCDEKVLRILGLLPGEGAEEEEEASGPVDPRWEKLKGLQNDDETE